MDKLAEIIIWEVGEIGKLVTDSVTFETVKGTIGKIEKEANAHGDRYCIWAMDLDTRHNSIVFANDVQTIYDFIIEFIVKQKLDDARIISTDDMRVKLIVIKYLEDMNPREALH